MYSRPHLIWVTGLVCQSEATVAILSPGRDCGMPYAPDAGFSASTRQPLSPIHNGTRQDIWELSKPYDGSNASAIDCGSWSERFSWPPTAGPEVRPSAARFAGSVAARRSSPAWARAWVPLWAAPWPALRVELVVRLTVRSA